MNRIRTDILEIAFEEGGPPDGLPVLLLHGWPDAPRGWNEVSQRLHADGYRTIAPFLRGSSPTEFLSKETPRVGAGVALAKDALDLANALGLKKFAVTGPRLGRASGVHIGGAFPRTGERDSRSGTRLSTSRHIQCSILRTVEMLLVSVVHVYRRRSGGSA